MKRGRTVLGAVAVACLMVAAAPPDLVRRTFTLKHRSPDRVAVRLRAFLSEQGTVQIVPARRELVVLDTLDRMAALARVVRRLDAPLRNLEVTVRLLRGERQTGSAVEETGVPEIIQKMRRFLRYDRFRPLESAYVQSEELQPVVVAMGPYRLRFIGEWAVVPAGVVRLRDLTLEQRTGADDRAAYRTLLSTTLNVRVDQPTVVGLARSARSETLLLLILNVRLRHPGDQ